MKHFVGSAQTKVQDTASLLKEGRVCEAEGGVGSRERTAVVAVCAQREERLRQRAGGCAEQPDQVSRGSLLET